MVGLHRRLLFGLLLSTNHIPLTLTDTDFVTWGSGPAANIPDATREAIEAAGGIARLVGSGESFYAITADGRCFSWGSGITAPGSSSALCAHTSSGEEAPTPR